MEKLSLYEIKIMNTIKVMFDTNVWLNVVIPDEHQRDSAYADFLKIHQAIANKVIDAYLSETIFTLDAIKKIDRPKVLSSHKLNVEVTIRDENDSVESIQKPDIKGINFDRHPIFMKYIGSAMKLGFKIVKLSRIGGFKNDNVEPILFNHQMSNEERKFFFNKAVETSRKIESNGAGMAHIKSLGLRYDTCSWKDGLGKLPETSIKNIALAVAEWADADSVAISIGLNCDYFCTRDKAKKAGCKSVLSENNLKWLSEDYGFKTISPDELAKKI